MILLRSDSRVFVAGHGGLVGSAVLRRLDAEGFTAVLTATRELGWSPTATFEGLVQMMTDADLNMVEGR